MKKLLIKNFCETKQGDSLLYLLTNNSIFIFTSDSSKQDLLSEGGYSNTTSEVRPIITDSNLDVRQHHRIQSYRSEICYFLTVNLFLKYYAKLCVSPINNTISILCENKAFVDKMSDNILHPHLLACLNRNRT